MHENHPHMDALVTAQPFKNAMWYALIIIHDFISHFLSMVSVSDQSISQSSNRLREKPVVNNDVYLFKFWFYLQWYWHSCARICFWSRIVCHMVHGASLLSIPGWCAGDIVTFILKVNWQLLTRQKLFIISQQMPKSHMVCWTYSIIQVFHLDQMAVSICKIFTICLEVFILHHTC